MILRWLKVTIVLCSVLWMPTVQAQAITTHDAVSGISATQVIEKQRVRINWNAVSTAKRYRVKILHNGVRIAKKTTSVARAKFKERKFKDNETYVIQVRAKAQPGFAATNWSTFSFTFNDIDHDNDLIADVDDFDDDNDGIPDSIDSNPIGVSGTVYSIVISDNSLVNGTITIERGDSVTWVNQDGDFDHTIVATNNAWFSPPLQYGESYTRVFNETGVFSYSDPIAQQSSMSGTISVINP